jgi:hypothetical protein
MADLLFTNARPDGVSADCAENICVRVAGGTIVDVSSQPIDAANAQVIDVGRRTLMPGLIDCHIHACASHVSLQKIETVGEAYRTAYAVRMLGHALDCGFRRFATSAAAIHGRISPRADPRAALLCRPDPSMTGGRGDLRPLEERATSFVPRASTRIGAHRRRCRRLHPRDARRLRRPTADKIRLRREGSTDPDLMNQYRARTRSAPGSSTNAPSARMSPRTANWRARSGVASVRRAIEHRPLIDARPRNRRRGGAYIVPTMVTSVRAVEQDAPGFPPESMAKAEQVMKTGLAGLEAMRRAGVKICYGSDLLGQLHVQQSREFAIRSEVFTPLEILRQATSTGAEMMMMEGKLGCVQPGAYADLLVVDGDPLKDISLLAAGGQNLQVIVRAGEIVKNALS